MAVKRRRYIALTDLALTTTEKNLQVVYNAAKTGAEKLSDDGVTTETALIPNTKIVSFGKLRIVHSVEIQVKLDAHLTHNDWITLPVVPSGVTSTVIDGAGGNIMIKAGGATTVDLYATILSQGQSTFE